MLLTPAKFEATTGLAQAMASTKARPKASDLSTEGKTATSAKL